LFTIGDTKAHITRVSPNEHDMTIGLTTDQAPAAPPRMLLRILLIGLSAILMLGAYRNSALTLDD
jgi:hypothetical protein